MTICIFLALLACDDCGVVQIGTRVVQEPRTVWETETRVREVTEYVPQIRQEEYQVQIPREIMEAREVPIYGRYRTVWEPRRILEEVEAPTKTRYVREVKTRSVRDDCDLPRVVFPRQARRVLKRHAKVKRFENRYILD